MADPNKNPGQTPPPPPPPDSSKSDVKQIVEDIQAKKKAEGDYRDILKESIANLKQISKQYDTIQDKLEGLLDDSINVKDIEKTLITAKEKQFRASKNLLDAEEKLTAEGKKRVEDYFKSSQKVQSLEVKQLENKKSLSSLIVQIADQEAVMADDSLKKSDDYLKHLNDQTGLTQTKLDIEKELAKTLLDIKNIEDGVVKADQTTIDNLQKKKISAQDLLKSANEELDTMSKKEEIFKSTLSKEERDLAIKKQQSDVSKKIFLDGEKELANAIELNDLRSGALTTEEAGYVAAKKAQDVANEGVEMAKKRLAEEKRIKDMTGVTGHLFEILANKVGLGDSVMGAMVKKARLLREEQEKTGKKGFFAEAGIKFKTLGAGLKQVGSNIKSVMSDPVAMGGAVVAGFKLAEAGLDAIGGAARKVGQTMAGMSKHTGDTVQNLTSGVSGLISKIPLIGGLFSGLIDGASAFLDLVLGVDNHIQKVGRSLGKSREEINRIKGQMNEWDMASGNVFHTSERMLESYQEIATQLGRNNELTKEQLEADIDLKEFLGYDLETRAKLVDISNIQGKSQEKIVKGVMAQTFALKQATGIQLNNKQIMKELTNLGGTLGLEFAKYPDKLAKTLITSKALGLSLDKLENIGGQFLDFESSISAEFEAQLLTGKNINLMKARELFLNNDLAGAAAEITSQIGSAEEYLHMNRIQQEAYAKAVGMSRDEMSNMLLEQEKLAKAQKIFGKDSVKNTEDLKQKVRLLIEQGDKQKAINILGSEQAYNDEARATAQDKLQASIEKIKGAFINMIEKSGIMDKVSKWIDMLTDEKNIKGIIGTIKNAVADFVEFSSGIIADALEFIGDLPGTDEAKWDKRAETVRTKMGGVADSIRGMGEAKAQQDLIKKQGQEKRETAMLQEKAEGASWWDYTKATLGTAMVASNPILWATEATGVTNIMGSQFSNVSRKNEEAEQAQRQAASKGITLPAKDFVIKTLPEDTVVAAGGTNLGRTDEIIKLLEKQNSLSKTRMESEYSPLGGQIAKKEVTSMAIGATTTGAVQESKKPEVKIHQEVKWDPITGPFIISQIDRGGGDVSKYLNPSPIGGRV